MMHCEHTIFGWVQSWPQFHSTRHLYACVVECIIKTKKHAFLHVSKTEQSKSKCCTFYHICFQTKFKMQKPTQAINQQNIFLFRCIQTQSFHISDRLISTAHLFGLFLTLKPKRWKADKLRTNETNILHQQIHEKKNYRNSVFVKKRKMGKKGISSSFLLLKIWKRWITGDRWNWWMTSTIREQNIDVRIHWLEKCGEWQKKDDLQFHSVSLLLFRIFHSFDDTKNQKSLHRNDHRCLISPAIAFYYFIIKIKWVFVRSEMAFFISLHIVSSLFCVRKSFVVVLINEHGNDDKQQKPKWNEMKWELSSRASNRVKWCSFPMPLRTREKVVVFLCCCHFFFTFFPYF